jgi:uncharacterized protein (TIGR02453 family)
MHLPALLQFLEGLAENNNKAWFVMNQPSYAILREEFTALVGEVIAKVARFDREMAGVDPKKALFRIYRDVRFSTDKTPYKTTFSAALAARGKKAQSPMYYFHVDRGGRLLTAAGCYHPPAEALLKIRQAIAARPTPLVRILRGAKLIETFGGIDQSEILSRPPKGFSVETPGIELIKLKSFIVVHEARLRNNAGPKLAEQIAERFEAGYPLVSWLRTILDAA